MMEALVWVGSGVQESEEPRRDAVRSCCMLHKSARGRSVLHVRNSKSQVCEGGNPFLWWWTDAGCSRAFARPSQGSGLKVQR